MYKLSRKYGLQGTDAMVFEALVWLSRQSKDGAVKISYSKLAEFSLCGGKMTACRSVNRLISQGIVSQNETGAYQIETLVSQNETISKEERTKEENININKSLPAIIACDKPSDDGWLAGFNLFWEKYNPSGEFKRRKNVCKKIWETLPEDWRKLATDRAGSHSSERNPLFYLRDEDFLKVGGAGSAKEEKASPEWLNPELVYSLLQGGAELVFCRRPEGKGFGTVTKADAERFHLQIVRDVKL